MVLGDRVAAYLEKIGAKVRRQEVEPGRANVIATFEPDGDALATVVLAPHLDTVGVAGMTVPPFQLTRKQGRLYGRGSCDTKGPMAALLAAFTAWSRSPDRHSSRVRWVFAATVAEETGGLGAHTLVESGFKADFAIALEPTDLKVVHANKGVLRTWITMQGRAAHGATPKAGLNAINRLLPLAMAIESTLAPRLARKTHPLLGAATVNLGVIAGGRELNIVPDQCRMGLDIRTHPKCTSSDVLRWLRSLQRRHAPGSKLGVFRDGPSYVTSRSQPWAQKLRRCGHGWSVANWFCDANYFAAAGIPAVAFGPGSIAQAHTKDEFITERALREGTAAFLRFLQST
jgi:acetylornithine deacetylase/succinyl-diaminopimelate desuccinylase-like protein